MPTDKIFKVFVSSTYEDLREERATVQRALLQLNCLPVGMELFPAADEDTWEFIKSQIRDSDYYVVVVAGRYGSLASDGLSYTEKEYDYATSQKIPSIGFVHADPGSISLNRSEPLKESNEKLQAFLAKLKQRPVRQFRSPHELALEVTTSFVQLIRDRPAVGYIRSNEAVDYKKYASLLEENNQLKEALQTAMPDVTPFPRRDREIEVTIEEIKNGKILRYQGSATLEQMFIAVGEAALISGYQTDISTAVANQLKNEGNASRSLTDASLRKLRREFVLLGLIEVSSEPFSSYNFFDKITSTSTVLVWRLTDYGRRQMLLLTNNE